MRYPALLCPHHPPLFDQLKGHDIAVRIDRIEDVSRAAEEVCSRGGVLTCVAVETDRPLSALPIPDGWDGIPVALFAPGMGRYRDLSVNIQKLYDFKTHVYLPAGDAENLVSCRILASLGVTCCLVFNEREPDWTALADLMTYATFGPVPHAPVEPFHRIANHYSPGACLDWGALYFDDPREYLHLDSRGRVALSRHGLSNGLFIADHISSIRDPLENEGYVKGLKAWRRYFLEDHPCTLCEGWRICLGRFGCEGRQRMGCSRFAADTLAEIEQYQSQRQENSSEAKE
jgi:hypothetical protein